MAISTKIKELHASLPQGVTLVAVSKFHPVEALKVSSVWNTEFAGETRTVDMHIRTLRQKLGSYGNIIETVRNVGYRLESGYDK